MSDGSVKISTKIDNSQLDKGLKETDKILGGLGSKFKISSVAAAGFAGAAALGVGKVVSVMNDCAAAYRVQEKAEKALEAASKNNPYLNDESVYNLKQFASELQKTSEIGDEVSIGLMAQLANAGRTQEEIQQIMQVSADMAASGAFTMDGAVKNLNKTFSGLSGELGEVVPELKNLTAEEMQNGKAIDVLKSKYKGMAEGTANTTVQLANSFGDLKENIGNGWEDATKPARKWLIEIIDKANEAMNKRREVEGAKEAIAKGTATSSNLKVEIEQIQNEYEKAVDYAKKLDDEWRKLQENLSKPGNSARYNPSNMNAVVGSSTKKEEELIKAIEKTQELEKKIAELEKAYTDLNEAEKIAAENAKKAAEEAAKITAQNEKNNKAQGYLKIYEESLAKQIESIKLKAQLEGRSIESAAVQQEVLNAKIGAYISLIEGSEGLITGNTEREKEKTKAIEAQTQAVKNLTDAEGEKQKSLDDAIAATEAARALIEQQPIDIKPEVKIQLDIDATKEEAEKLRKKIDAITDDELAALEMTNDEKIALIEDVNKKELELVEALEREKERLRKDGVQKERDDFADKVSMLNDYMQKANDIAQGIQQFATKQIETERDLRIAEIENSTMSEEEKEKAILEIRRESAKKQYQVDMFAWTASLLAATANIAQGVSTAIAQGGVAGIITGALVAAAGGIQIATIFANKPRPPSFAGGGIVQGGSYSGDRIQANVNSGEMILNANQQRALWETANNKNSERSQNIVINNSAANMVSAQPSISKNQIEILIDARVNKSMAAGKYNGAYRQMQGGLNGVSYG